VHRKDLYDLAPENHRVNQRGRAIGDGPSDEFCQLVARLFMEVVIGASR
jgi:hypothetical protein